MAWIELHQSLPTHKKTLAAADRLDMPPVHLMGHLTALWLWVLDNAPDGDITSISARTIARVVQWEGSPDVFLDALIEAGFIACTDEGTVIHDWNDYAGRLVEKRKANAARMKHKRATHVQHTCNARAGATVPNRTIPNRTKNTRRASDDARPVEGSPETDEDTEHVTNGESLEVKTASGTAPTRTVDRSTTRTDKTAFDSFWSAYPKKVGKGAAETAWRKLKPGAELAQTMLAAIAAAQKSDQWQRDGGQYIPNPATWLSQRRWEDEHVAPALAERRGHSRLPPAADSRGSKYDEIDIIRRRMARQELEARNNRGEVQ